MRAGNKLLTLLLVCMLLCSGCAGNNGKTEPSETSDKQSVSDRAVTTESRELFAMDTVMMIRATGVDAKAAVDEAAAEIERLDALLSVGSEESEVTKLNRNGGGVMSEDVKYLTERSLEIYDSTGGAYDITIYPLMELWGFTGDHPAVPDAKEIERVISESGSDKLKINGNTLTLGAEQGIDFGGIAKGYASSRIMEIFEKKGMISGLVSLGGNVHCFRTKEDGSAWKCGVTDPEHPDDNRYLLGILHCSDQAVITSGGYERYFQDESGKTYHHIMDPKTGYPAKSGLTSVTIVSKDGTLADALSTACFVSGEQKAAAYWRSHRDEFDMILQTDDGRLLVSEGISDAFESERSYQVISYEG